MTNPSPLSLIVGQTVTVNKCLWGGILLSITGRLMPLFEGYFIHQNGVRISFSDDDLASMPARNGTVIEIFLK